jgi:hypothetical protein
VLSAIQRHFVIRATVQFPTGQVFAHPTPLLEEERHMGAPALFQNRANPLRLHRARTGTRLTADDHLVDPVERKVIQWTQ